MKRRHFLRLTLIGVAATGLPLVGCRHSSGKNQYLDQPLVLSRFCDEASILEIGKAYRAMDPQANDARWLRNVLLADILGDKGHVSDTDEVPVEELKNRVQKDFEDNLIVTPAGWIIARTEARQCALYSFTV